MKGKLYIENSLLEEIVEEWKEKTKCIIDYYELVIKMERRLVKEKEKEIDVLQERLRKKIVRQF